MTEVVAASAVQDAGPEGLAWSAASLARLNRIPEQFRQKARDEIEARARALGASEISGDVEEAGFAAARRLMCPEPEASDRSDKTGSTSRETED